MVFMFFNLLVNSVFSLFIAFILVSFFLWFFRVETGRWKVLLLSLPFVKIVYDFVRGVPEKSVLFSGVDPFSLPPNHQLLSIGAGFDGFTPYVSTVLSVNALDGTIYNSSIGDYLLIWIHRTFGEQVPAIMVLTVLFISFALLGTRLVQYYRFERRRRIDRKSLEQLNSIHASRKVVSGRRVVDVYISPNFSGTPFTGGILKPYICIPEDASKVLDVKELDAVVAHETGHVMHYDLVVTVIIQCLGDVFWFVPGYRWLSRRIDQLREVVADAWAVQSMVDPFSLASAIIKLKEIPERHDRYVLYSAFFRERSLLKERIERLVGEVKDRSPRFGWQKRWIRYVITIFILIVVLNSVFGGNYKREAVTKAPDWIEDLLEVSCFCVGHKFYASA